MFFLLCLYFIDIENGFLNCWIRIIIEKVSFGGYGFIYDLRFFGVYKWR